MQNPALHLLRASDPRAKAHAGARSASPRRAWLRAGGLTIALAAAPACKGESDTAVAERLWVSVKPSDARQEFSALAVTQVGKRSFGGLHQGSTLRGRWELFAWRPGGRKGEATLEFLQDGARHVVKVEGCRAPRGFDLCMKLVGDPTGVGTWYSKKRWALRRKASEASEVGASSELADALTAEARLAESLAELISAPPEG